MDHDEAIRTHAAERYLLGELSEQEQEAFEVHYFECGHCAEEVRLGEVFRANAASVLADWAPSERSATSPDRRMGWAEFWAMFRQRPVLAAACGLLLAFTSFFAYRGLVVVPQLQGELARATSPQPFASLFLSASSRGAEQVIEAPAGQPLLGLSWDVPPDLRFESYRWVFTSQSGEKEYITTAEAPAPPESAIHVLVPAYGLPAGRYVLTIRGLPGEEQVASYAILIQGS